MLKLKVKPTRAERRDARKYGIVYVGFVTRHKLRYWVPLHYRKR